MIEMPDKWTREEQAAWNRVRNRMPGIEKDIERTVCRMAVGTGKGGQVRIDYQQTSEGFVARLEVYTWLDNCHITPAVYPVIPDHANPDNYPITRDMGPFVFKTFKECRETAEKAERTYLRALRSLESGL